jgi:hypothetical protein
LAEYDWFSVGASSRAAIFNWSDRPLSSARMSVWVISAGLSIEGSLIALVVSQRFSGASPQGLGSWLPWLLAIWPAIFLIALLVWHTMPEQLDRRTTWIVIGFAAIFRATVLPLPPSLSDDLYRYVWDGQLVLAGYSPYRDLPTDPRLAAISAASDGEILAKMNSRSKYSVYPPLAQLLFATAAALGKLVGAGFLPAYYALKGLLVLCDLAAIGLLWSWLQVLGCGTRHLLLYAWNPLAIIEFAAAGHSEALMIPLLLLTFLLLAKSERVAGSAGLASAPARVTIAALVLAAAVLAKLLPLLLVPFFARRYGWRYLALIVGICVAATWPLLDWQAAGGVSTSLRGYFGTYEFNNGLYWSAATVCGLDETGRKTLLAPGFGVGFALLYALIWFASYRRSMPLPDAALWIFSAYLLTTPVLHPWYLGSVVCLMAYRPTACWLWMSAAAGFSYTAYVRQPFAEDLVVVAWVWSVFIVLLLLAGLGRPPINTDPLRLAERQ